MSERHRYEYGFWGRHFGLARGIAWAAATIALVVAAHIVNGRTDPKMALLILGTGAAGLALCAAGDLLNARRFRPLLVSDEGLGREIGDGSAEWIPWSSVDRIEWIPRRSGDYQAGGFKTGVLVRSPLGVIAIYEHLRGFRDVYRTVQQVAGSRGLPVYDAEAHPEYG